VYHIIKLMNWTVVTRFPESRLQLYSCESAVRLMSLSFCIRMGNETPMAGDPFQSIIGDWQRYECSYVENLQGFSQDRFPVL